jgi:hypothetical protein
MVGTCSCPAQEIGGIRILVMDKFVAKSSIALSSPTLADRMWSKLATCFNETSFSNMRVFVLGCGPVERVWFRDSLRQIGVKSISVEKSSVQLSPITSIAKSFTHVIVNLDAYESTEDAVDALLDFRKAAPDSVVIAVSSMVVGDDFGQERSAICDVTLRMPVTERRLRQGLTRGEANRLDALR